MPNSVRTSLSMGNPCVGQYSPPPMTASPAESRPVWMDFQQGRYSEEVVVEVLRGSWG